MTTSSNADDPAADHPEDGPDNRPGNREAPRFWQPAGPDADCPRCGGVGYIRRRVPVGHELFGRAVPCECAQQQAADRLAAELQRLSNLGPLAGQRLAQDEIQTIDEYADACAFADEQTAERWLVIAARPAAERTRLAAELANRRLQRGQPALYFVASDLLDRLRAAYRRDAEMTYPVLFEHAREAPFLIIDDIDMANPTEWAREKLFQLLNHRWNAQLRTVLIAADRAASGDPLGLARWLAPAAGALHLRLSDAPAVPNYRQVGGMRRDLLAQHTFDNFQEHGRGGCQPLEGCNLKMILGEVRDWAASPSGTIALCGGTGTGKTHLAAATANVALERGETVWFAVVPDLLDLLRSTYQADSEHTYDALFQSLRDADLLILDDFGAHSPTPWANEKLYQLYAARYVALRPTMVTTNLRPEELGDDRIASRLLATHNGANGKSKWYQIKALDYRTGVEPAQGRADERSARRRSRRR